MYLRLLTTSTNIKISKTLPKHQTCGGAKFRALQVIPQLSSDLLIQSGCLPVQSVTSCAWANLERYASESAGTD